MGVIQCKYRPSDGQEANLSNNTEASVSDVNEFRKSSKLKKSGVLVENYHSNKECIINKNEDTDFEFLPKAKKNKPIINKQIEINTNDMMQYREEAEK